MANWETRGRILLILSFMMAASCRMSGSIDVPPGVSWDLAVRRAQAISDVRYDLRLTIPREPAEPVMGDETISFRSTETDGPLILDFTQPVENVLSVQTSGREIEFAVTNGHLIIPDIGDDGGTNTVRILFHAGNAPLNREPDSLYSLFVPNRASQVFPCFDQPNLKGRFQVTLDVPAGWQAVSNGRLESRDETGERAVCRFAETQPISTYLFSFLAGDFKVESAERNGRRMQMYHRESDAEKVRRNVAKIFDLHIDALNWLEDYTGIQYPFDKFDFILIPSFQFSGMEHPGAILYRASSLFLDESATQAQELKRASLIAHETAHMWFGNLVTMNWFDDVWMKEVFANFMAAEIVNPAFPKVNHELRFFLAHYPAAYEVDRTEGTNPIRQPLDNLNDAASLYGAIIYQKAPIVMRQLERLMGETDFREGLRDYLNRYRFGNASWPELIEILDQRTPENLGAWSQVWVEQPGRPKITPYLALNADGTISSLTLRQTDPKNQGRLWPQKMDVLVGSGGRMQSFPIRLSEESLNIRDAGGLPKPEFILADGEDIGYGLFELDPLSREFLSGRLASIRDPRTRAVAWVTLWDSVLESQVPPRVFIDQAITALPTETEELNVQRITDYVTTAYWSFISNTERVQLAPVLEALLWDRIKKSPETSLKSTWFQAYLSVVQSETGLQVLENVWRGDTKIPGLPFSEQDQMKMALELAVREAPDWSGILNEQLGRIKDPERKERFEFVMPAVSADSQTREDFFKSLADVANRRHEPWVLEALSYLHHPNRAVSSERFLRPSLEMLEEIQRTGDIFFPKGWLDATFSGHSSDDAASIVRQFLHDHPDYPSRLKAKILQSADRLFRATAILGGHP